MKKYLARILLFLVLSGPSWSGYVAAAQNDIDTPSSPPLAFTKNVGQWDDQVLYRVQGNGATTWLTERGLTHQFIRTTKPTRAVSRPSWATSANMSDLVERFLQGQDSIEQLVVSAIFVGANSNPEVVAEGLTEYKCNYFSGSDPKNWFSGVPNYQSVTYRNLYDGIDVTYEIDSYGNLEEHIVANRRANIANVVVKYNGIETISAENVSEIAVKTSWGTLIRRTWFSHEQGDPNSPRAAANSVTIRGDGSLGFDLEHGSRTLDLSNRGIVSTFWTDFAGSDLDRASGVAADGNMQTYVCGVTFSSDFPTMQPLQTDQPDADIFVTKLDSSGLNFLYSTYIGGEFDDRSSDLVLDEVGNVYVIGWSNSDHFPTTNPLYTHNSGLDVVLFELNADGDSLKFGSYFGGGSADYGTSITILDDGSLAITGNTESTDFPTVQPIYGTNRGKSDVFVMRIDPIAQTVVFSTFIGGYDWDYGYGIAAASSAGIWVTGTTHSPNFPTVNQLQNEQGQGDAFLVLLDRMGTALKLSTYLGGSDWDEGTDVAIDSSGSACFVGYTASTNFPTLHAIQPDQPGWDIVTGRVDTSGHMTYSTYIGGTSSDFGMAIAVNCADAAYITGWTDSPDLPFVNPSRPYGGGNDAILICLNPAGTRVPFATYVGNSNADQGSAIAADCLGHALLSGSSGGNAFAVRLRAYLCGDVDENSMVNISDVVKIVAIVFSGSNTLSSSWAGDADCNHLLNVSDAVYLIRYIFSGGAAPCAACP